MIVRSVPRSIWKTAFIALGVAGLAIPAWSASLADLDRILAKAPSLEVFLSSHDLREEYFHALQAYLGKDKIKHESYEKILSQVAGVSREVPGFSARIWSRHGFPSFSIETNLADHGFTVHTDAFQSYLSKWRQSLRVTAAPLYEIKDAQKREQKLHELAEELQSRIARFEAEMKALPEADPSDARAIKVRNRQRGAFAETIHSDPGAKALTAYYLNEHLGTEEMGDAFRTGDADVILDALEDLKLRPTQVIPQDAPVTKELATRLDFKRMIDSVSILKKNPELFSPRMVQARGGARPAEAGKPGTYTFRAVEVPFNGIWKGIPLGECVGGSCDWLSETSPERWGTVALKDSELYYVEKDGSPNGFIHEIPIQLRKTGERFYSVDLASSYLTKKAFRKPGQLPETLFRKWLEHVHIDPRKAGRRYLVGTASGGDNARVLGHVRSQTEYLFGQVAGSSQDFDHLDEVGRKIPGVIKPAGIAKNYAGRMMFDAFLPDSKELTELGHVEPGLAADPERLRKRLLDLPEASALSFLNKLSNPVRDYLETLLEHPSQVVRERAFMSAPGIFLAGPQAEKLASSIFNSSRASEIQQLLQAMIDHPQKQKWCVDQAKTKMTPPKEGQPQVLELAMKAYLLNGGDPDEAIGDTHITPAVRHTVLQFMLDQKDQRVLPALDRLFQSGRLPLSEVEEHMRFFVKNKLRPEEQAAVRKIAEPYVKSDFFPLALNAQGVMIQHGEPLEEVLSDKTYLPGAIRFAFKNLSERVSRGKPLSAVEVHAIEALMRDKSRPREIRQEAASVLLSSRENLEGLEDTFLELIGPDFRTGEEGWKNWGKILKNRFSRGMPQDIAFAARVVEGGAFLSGSEKEAFLSLLKSPDQDKRIGRALSGLWQNFGIETRYKIVIELLSPESPKQHGVVSHWLDGFWNTSYRNMGFVGNPEGLVPGFIEAARSVMSSPNAEIQGRSAKFIADGLRALHERGARRFHGLDDVFRSYQKNLGEPPESLVEAMIRYCDRLGQEAAIPVVERWMNEKGPGKKYAQLEQHGLLAGMDMRLREELLLRLIRSQGKAMPQAAIVLARQGTFKIERLRALIEAVRNPKYFSDAELSVVKESLLEGLTMSRPGHPDYELLADFASNLFSKRPPQGGNMWEEILARKLLIVAEAHVKRKNRDARVSDWISKLRKADQLPEIARSADNLWSLHRITVAPQKPMAVRTCLRNALRDFFKPF